MVYTPSLKMHYQNSWLKTKKQASKQMPFSFAELCIIENKAL